MTPNDDPKPTARGIAIGAELRRARQAVGMRCADVAERFGWSLSKVSRMETGHRGVGTVDLVRFATVCNMAAHRLDRVLALSAGAGARVWLETGADAGELLRVLEENAKSVTAYDGAAVPELARTDAYHRTLGGDCDDLGRRRRAFEGELDGKQLRVLVHESTLLTPVGDHHVMVDQLDALIALAQRPGHAVVIAPAAALSPSGPTTLLSDAHDHHTVLLHNLTNTVVLDDAAHTSAYKEKLDALTRTPRNQAVPHLTEIRRHHARRRFTSVG